MFLEQARSTTTRKSLGKMMRVQNKLSRLISRSLGTLSKHLSVVCSSFKYSCLPLIHIALLTGLFFDIFPLPCTRPGAHMPSQECGVISSGQK